MDQGRRKLSDMANIFYIVLENLGAQNVYKVVDSTSI